jgi:hypothetical protein
MKFSVIWGLSVMSLFFLRDKTPCGLSLGTVLASIGFGKYRFL